MKLAWVALIAGLAAAQTPPPDQTGSIGGVVVDAVTRQPVKKAMVSVNARQAGGMVNAVSQSASTDVSGAFTLTGLPPGEYRLLLQHPNYPQARNGAVTKSVEVKAGEKAGPVTLELIPGAVLTGHVYDEDGDPLPGCQVQPHPAKNPAQGVAMQGTSMSDENGEYRLANVPPGKYVVTARCGRPVFQARPFSAGPDPPPSLGYAMQYYPMTSELKSAGVIELTPALEKAGVDFRMRPTPITQIHGAFSPAGADWHGVDLNVQLVPSEEKSAGLRAGARVDNEKGTFDFQQVFPGSYMLAVVSNSAQVGAVQPIEVKDEPIQTVIVLKHSIDVSGTVDLENSSGAKITPGMFTLQIMPELQTGMGYGQTQVNPDGTFTFKNVMPGVGRIRLNGPNVFLKAAWFGNTEVTGKAIDFASGGGSLKLTVSTNTATIRGSAPAGLMVFAELADDNLRMTRSALADPSGQFKIENLGPGKYRLTTAVQGSPAPDEGGQEITLHEGETIMVELKDSN